jgi:hypothetical protein
MTCPVADDRWGNEASLFPDWSLAALDLFPVSIHHKIKVDKIKVVYILEIY